MQIPIIPYQSRGQGRPWPSLPRINWQHPIANGLIFYHFDHGDGGYDLVGNRNMTQHNPGTPIGRKISEWGTTYQGDGSVSNGVQYTSDTLLREQPPMSWGMAFNRATATTENAANMFGRAANNAASQPFFNWGIVDNYLGGTNTVAPQWDNNGAINGPLAGKVLGVGAYHTVLAAAPNTTTVQWWADGVQQTTTTSQIIQNVTTGDPVLLYTDLGGPGGFAGNIYWAAFWNRTLTTPEAFRLHYNPYDFLIFPEDDLYAEWVGQIAFNPALLQGTQQEYILKYYKMLASGPVRTP